MNRISLNWLIYSALVLVVGLLFVGAFQSVGWPGIWLVTLYATVGLAAWTAWRHIPWPDEVARFTSVGAVVLLMAVINRLFFIGDYILSGDHFDFNGRIAPSPEWAILKGEIVTAVGILVMCACWYISGGLKVSPLIALQEAQRSKWFVNTLLIVSLVVIAISSIFSSVEAGLGQLFPTVFALGIVSVILIPAVYFREAVFKVTASIILSLPFVWVALGKGMKEGLVVAIFPIAITAWRSLHGASARGVLLVGGFLIVSFTTMYVGFYRAEVWYGEVDRPLRQVISDFGDEVTKVGPGNMIEIGVKEFLERNNASYHRGLAVSIADEVQFYPDLVFGPLMYVFIPRMFWPDKPEIKQGWEYSGLVFGQEYMEFTSSSTAAGLFTSFYLGAGWLGVLVGAIAVGVILSWCTQICIRFGGQAMAGFYSFAMFPALMRIEEIWSVGALSGPVVTMAYLIIIIAVVRVFGRFLLSARLRNFDS